MSGQRAKVFDETYRRYLKEIQQIDFLAKAEALGVTIDNNSLKIPLYDKMYRFGPDGIVGGEQEVLTPAVQVMICKYILTCPLELPAIDNTLMTYREFKDAGPLISYFTTNTNKTIESTFSGNLEGLKKRGQDIGGKLLDSDIYDLSMEFLAFPRIPVIVNFNDRDDLFSATCSVLYHSSAAYFLDMECLAMTGTLLTGKLIASVRVR
jgi:hypothetical protein